ncbi:hypothetical protein CHLRE_14g614800v5 [Chlamydomonas reinhardtii]|uniref:Uncharacterized protein n=1 Tax=Chlamydomonas reinhardtii TaxID=3055 RepID=A0A2K3CXH2_CHLRE|nr:uncharacterized protein CHLRE_14g614800v5 [Chlamydomonas reinhardtii]PNW72996.1 hypothetical protein CHLRE_14g614800v5 [Chlamydomonas reinhardtii]
MGPFEALMDFLRSERGPIAVASLVMALGLIVMTRYLLRIGGVVSKRASAGAVSAKPSARATAAAPSAPKASAATKAAPKSASVPHEDEDDVSGKATRRSRRYA